MESCRDCPGGVHGLYGLLVLKNKKRFEGEVKIRRYFNKYTKEDKQKVQEKGNRNGIVVKNE